MRVWGCASCGTSYRARIYTCPRCKGTEMKEFDMPKISVFGGVTDVRAAGLLPGTAEELPVEVVDRADGSVTEVNSEFDQDADPDDVRSPNADITGQGTDNPPPSGEGRVVAESFPDGIARPASEGGNSAEGDKSGDSGNGDNSGENDNSADSGDSGKRDTSDDDPPFDPGEFTVAEVKAKLADLSDEDRERVVAAERAGKDRAGITG
jgi:hypothetical protein